MPKSHPNTKMLKPSVVEDVIRIQAGLQYQVSQMKREDKTIDGKRESKRYYIITKDNESLE